MLHVPPHPRGLSGRPPESPLGVLGLTREGRKVSVGANSPDTGEKAAAAFVRALPQQPHQLVLPWGSPAAWLLWWYPQGSLCFTSSPSFPSENERGWESWRPAWSGGVWGSPFGVWEHQNLRGCGQHWWTLQSLQFVHPKASGHSRSL